ncbi:MAG: hypothetical protein MJZ53_00760 [Paludibacteraceae bacterium]|nr:hypothetical protein [Paludibacteraceae bacterium]
MKNKFFNRLFLLSTALITMSVNVWSATYSASVITAESDLEDGGLYIILQDGHVLINTVTSDKAQTTDTYKTTNLAGTENYVWKLIADGTQWKIQSAASATNYLSYKTGKDNKGKISMTTSNLWTITYESSKWKFVDSESRFLGYVDATSYQYKTYANSNYDAGTYPNNISLLKLSAGSSKADVTLTPTQNARNVTVNDIVEDLSSWYTVTPAAYDGTITYTSSNEEVFTEEEGAGYAFSTGTCNLYINASETSNYKAANCTISVTVSAPANQYTVTFLNNGQPVTSIGTNGVKIYNEGEALGPLPTQGDMTPCDGTSITFRGWYAGDPIREKQKDPPTFVTSSTTVNDNMTLRAVWAREQ